VIAGYRVLDPLGLTPNATMTAHALMYVDKETFYRFIEKADDQYRYEYVRGWIMQQQQGGTFHHARVGSRFVLGLSRLVDPAVWCVTGADRGIDTGKTVRYADAVVEKLGADPGSLSTKAPALIVEVISPSSIERDLGSKPAEYLALSSLQAYVVASQDEPMCYVWVRRPDGRFEERPAEIKGRDQVIQVPALGIAISLADVYRGIGE
jgi:Uma2 family endonuclease